ncbi:MAG: FtsH protease activity modulator HflK [Gammaproteobacteria bacterium]|nr:FtsH protease activity modulator HflK [Gammaproteobacteria bacterium]MCP4831582.1 FtsH protease activity modulator HflK [Gammaproteobacteria bacterium]MCP4927805.1 FtsH protease activity modulator HflK [Gammaproteobacteria bacterium]
MGRVNLFEDELSMAWNDSGNGKNPWDRGPGQEGPPDLDKIIRDWQKKFSAMFGGGSSKGSSGKGGKESNAPLFGLLVLVLLAWSLTGFYQVDAAERGIVQRFGAYTETTQPGLRWHLPWPIEMVDKVNVSVVNTLKQTTSMLTADENIVIVDMVVQYQNSDPMAYLFDIDDPVGTLADASESAIREVMGKSVMDYVLGEGRAPIAIETQQVIQAALDEYSAGIMVTKVNLQDVNFPSQVEAAVQDAIKAREDKERLKFEAESYANDILPRARGNGVRKVEDAEAYKAGVVANAEGEASRFVALLAEYKKAPQVTRERMYIDAIEYVYGNSTKVLLDAEGSGNLLYLPVDELIKQRAESSPSAGSSNQATPVQSGAAGADRGKRDDRRARGAR